MLGNVAVWPVLARAKRDLMMLGAFLLLTALATFILAVVVTRRLSFLTGAPRFETCRAHQFS